MRRSTRLAFILVAALLTLAGVGRAAPPPISAGQWASFRANVKAHNADAVATAYQAKKSEDLAALYNGASGTSIWRTAVMPSELVANIVVSEFIALAVNGDQKRSAMLMLVQLGSGGLDASNANVRASFLTIWTGTTTLTNLLGVAQRSATLFEAIPAFLSAAAPANVCDPAIYGHTLTKSEVSAALWDDNGNPL